MFREPKKPIGFGAHLIPYCLPVRASFRYAVLTSSFPLMRTFSAAARKIPLKGQFRIVLSSILRLRLPGNTGSAGSFRMKVQIAPAV